MSLAWMRSENNKGLDGDRKGYGKLRNWSTKQFFFHVFVDADLQSPFW
jgi:hypothetical protein